MSWSAVVGSIETRLRLRFFVGTTTRPPERPSASERTNEIGLKKALGATSNRILLEFFLEGLLLAVLSGAAGLILVLTLAKGVNSLPLPQMFSGLPIHWTVLALATLALGLVAVGASLPPARKAAAMTPVEALRFEK